MAPPEVLEAVDLTLTTIAPHERADLDARLRRLRAQMLDDRVRVLVVGEFKQGKSHLVNALINAGVCPVDDDIATSVPTAVFHGTAESATVVRSDRDEADSDPAGGVDGQDRSTERRPIPLDQLAGYVSERGNPGNRERLHQVEVGVPRKLLEGGLELVDTPGVGGLGSVHGAITMAALPSADAVLLVSDATSELTATEMDFLRQAMELCPNVAAVLTKIDLYPQWRQVAQSDREHLAAAGIEAPVFCVSSTLRMRALRTDDVELNGESGFPHLTGYLRERVVGRAEALARRTAMNQLLGGTEQLAAALRAERAAQQDPEHLQELVSELNRAQQRAKDLKDRSAHWQQTLNDGIADLNADIDYDLKDRMRQITREAENEVERGGDPTRMWQDFSSWVQRETGAAASATFVWATQRARYLAGQVAEHFSVDERAVVPTLPTGTDPEMFDRVRNMKLGETEPFGVEQKAFAGLRGGYIGVLMFGLLSSIAGFGLLNPVSLGAGVVLGGKTVRDERRRVTTRRKSETKSAVRQYCDDVAFQVGKESKDMLRRVQRELRDHFSEQADEMSRSVQESIRAAESAMTASRSERDRRLGELESELERLSDLDERIRGLLAENGRAQ